LQGAAVPMASTADITIGFLPFRTASQSIRQRIFLGELGSVLTEKTWKESEVLPKKPKHST
jgi:hypothetical protein